METIKNKPIKIGRTEYNPLKFKGYSKQQFLDEFKSLPAEYAEYLDAAWAQVQSFYNAKPAEAKPETPKTDADSPAKPKKFGTDGNG